MRYRISYVSPQSTVHELGYLSADTPQEALHLASGEYGAVSPGFRYVCEPALTCHLDGFPDSFLAHATGEKVPVPTEAA